MKINHQVLLMADAAPGGGGSEKQSNLVKIRVRRLVEEIDKKTGEGTGKVRNAAQPIVLSPLLKKQHAKGVKLPERLEVNGTYEVPAALAKALQPDVEIVN